MKMSGDVRYFPIAARNMCSAQLLQEARQSLRCIDWVNITKELMTGAICGAVDATLQMNQLFELSRPVRKGERIDYFMSHSWHDDAEAKCLADLGPRPVLQNAPYQP